MHKKRRLQNWVGRGSPINCSHLGPRNGIQQVWGGLSKTNNVIWLWPVGNKCTFEMPSLTQNLPRVAQWCHFCTRSSQHRATNVSGRCEGSSKRCKTVCRPPSDPDLGRRFLCTGVLLQPISTILKKNVTSQIHFFFIYAGLC